MGLKTGTQVACRINHVTTNFPDPYLLGLYLEFPREELLVVNMVAGFPVKRSPSATHPPQAFRILDREIAIDFILYHLSERWNFFSWKTDLVMRRL